MQDDLILLKFACSHLKGGIMGKLDKKVAIVTGGGTGIGRSIALTFAKEGASVEVCGRTSDTLREVVNEINALGKRALAVTVDVRLKEQVQNMETNY